MTAATIKQATKMRGFTMLRDVDMEFLFARDSFDKVGRLFLNCPQVFFFIS